MTNEITKAGIKQILQKIYEKYRGQGLRAIYLYGSFITPD